MRYWIATLPVFALAGTAPAQDANADARAAMAIASVADRVTALEREVAALKAQLAPAQAFNAANYTRDAAGVYWPVGTMPAYAASFGDAGGCTSGSCGTSAGRGLFGRRR